MIAPIITYINTTDFADTQDIPLPNPVVRSTDKHTIATYHWELHSTHLRGHRLVCVWVAAKPVIQFK